MVKIFSLFVAVVISISLNSVSVQARPPAKNTAYFQLKVYHFANSRQEAIIDSFLQFRYLPALHAAGLNNVGVFKAINNDTATDKKMYVFIPFESLKQWEKFSSDLRKNEAGDAAGAYNSAVNDNPAYSRIETIFLRAFELMPKLTVPNLKGPKSERVYELRSYEGASENLYRKKVKMFNQGGEMDIFTRLGFNAVFYGEVLFGCKMPNLMYMTTFDNMKSRDEHWQAFGSDPAWKTLSGLPEYQKTISHADIFLLRPTEYSEL